MNGHPQADRHGEEGGAGGSQGDHTTDVEGVAGVNPTQLAGIMAEM